MPQSLSQLIVHAVFSTKGRAAIFQSERRSELHAHMAGVLKTSGCRPIFINGVADHVHLLFALPATLTLADALRTVKGKSSAWMRRRDRLFSWQAGYAAFSVSQSSVDQVVRYIERQEEHHSKQSFQEELRELLRLHRLEWDERYLWD